jgi:hypothetical protein
MTKGRVRSAAETFVFISAPAGRVFDDIPQHNHAERDPEHPSHHIAHANLDQDLARTRLHQTIGALEYTSSVSFFRTVTGGVQ